MILAVAATVRPAAAEEARPWRLAEAVGSPEWLHFALRHQIRYAHLFHQFRAGRPGDGGMLPMRTNVLAELRPGPMRVGAELADSRAYLHNDVTVPNATMVDAVSLLQAYVGLELEDALRPGDALRMRIGRITMDVGSRRLAARNIYRNGINAFTGIDTEYGAANGPRFRLFVTMPIERLPTEREAVEDNAVVFNRESLDVIFAGQLVEAPPFGPDIRAEIYAFELIETDSAARPTRNRRLITPGVRLRRPADPGRLDFEYEGALQVGHSRASASPDDTRDLDHLATLLHAELGYTFDVPTTPRVFAQYDQASGDGDPRDESNQRFDPLYGVAKPDYGPTGIYTAFTARNVRGPALGVQVKPHRTLGGYFRWRAVWLDESRDAWTTAGLVDPTGQSGSFLGNQVEARVRYDPLVGNLRLEVGAVHLFAGEFAENAPGANDQPDATLLYTQLVLKL